MNCEAIHRCLFALEHLDEMPSDVRKHLNQCAGCRAMHEQLVTIETEVPLLSVPAPTRKAAFLAEFARPVPVETKTSLFNLTTLFRPTSDGKREKALRKVAFSVAMAATLLISVFGIWLWKQGGNVPNGNVENKDTIKSWLVEQKTRDIRWQEAKTPADRVRLYDELAIEVEGKAFALVRVDNSRELSTQLNRYKEVIDSITTQEAPGMTVEEKARLLSPIANRLATIESEARRLAVQHPEVSEKLEEFAMIAAEGDRRIRGLL